MRIKKEIEMLMKIKLLLSNYMVAVQCMGHMPYCSFFIAVSK